MTDTSRIESQIGGRQQPRPGSEDGRSTRLVHIWLLGLAAVAAFALLVATSGDLWFYFDEWEVIRNRALDLDSLLRPHNEHFSAVLVLIHRGLVELVGIDSYAPFLAVLWATHLFAAATVYVVLREDGSAWQATAGAIVFLVPGAGGQNLVTAFQVGFLLPTALGCLALAVCLTRPAVAAALLTVAVATTGVGLFYLVATVIRLIGRRSLVWLALPVGAYGAWFLAYGQDALGTHGAGVPESVPAYVAYGLAAAFGQGFPIAGAMVIAMIAVAIRGRAGDRLVLASLAGLLSMYVTTGLVRAQLGVEQATASRYTSVAMPFVLVIALAAWRSASERYPLRRLGPVFVVGAVGVGLISFAVFRAAWPAILAADPAR